MKNNIWLIWLAVMGENLALNIANKWYKISVFNRTSSVTDEFIKKNNHKNITWFIDLKEFVESLERPRKVIIMVKAWSPVDETIEKLKPFLSKDDIIIDCWNSFYVDTKRRYEYLKNIWLNFIWCWVSWWEEWALKWPSIMPWWEENIYKKIENILQDISAYDFSWWKCVSFIGDNWAGHYVKMIHNWIEYAIMQMMAEWYDLLRKLYQLSASEISEIFNEYNNWKLKSFLFEISKKVLSKKDEFNDKTYLIDNILDTAWSKWTWMWSSIEWLEKWISVSTIIDATNTRNISANKTIRQKLFNLYKNIHWVFFMRHQKDLNVFKKELENTLYIWMLIAYAQWLSLIKETSKIEKWNIDFSEITRIWQWWCIIRADLLSFLTNVFKNNSDFDSILELKEIQKEIENWLNDYKKVIILWIENAIPLNSLLSWYNYIHSITNNKLPTNFIQWLRDYFWAHTYERIDREGIFHTKW